jgi:uncharacterized membrane protein YphA (DoxX/SURF4 family)
MKSFLQKYREPILIYFSTLLVLLWVYTAFSKLTDLNEFKRQLESQTLGKTAASLLLWFIPISEVTAAALLLIRKTRPIGFIVSALLMFLFTGYIALVLLGYYNRIPCSCGGVLKAMGWQMHFWFNLFFLFVSMMGIYLERKRAKSS